MSWEGNHEKAIAKANMVLQVGRNPQTLVSAASAYYSGAGATLVRWKRQPWNLFLVRQGWVWSRKALQLVDEARQNAMTDGMPATYNLTFDQIDVMCTIWHRFGTAKQQLWGFEILSYASVRLDVRTASTHTLTFISLHRVRYGLDEWSDEIHDRALRSAQQVAKQARQSVKDKQSGLGQAARIMSQLAELVPKSDKRHEQHLKMAEAYAREGGATDQLVKLKK
jgi:hypothetical protein